MTELKLTSLTIDTIRELPSLTALPNLEVLSLTDSAPATWDESFYTNLGLVADWIRSCTKLKRLEVRKFMHDAELLSQVMMSDDIHLTSLSFAGFKLTRSGGFLPALGSHTSLQTLYLRGEGSEDPRDNNLLVDAVGVLGNLGELELKDVSDWFTMEQVEAVTSFLPHLERLWISGEAFNDSIWPAFACLTKLKSLAIYALSNFTANGVVDFISQLGPNNKGLSLSILNATSGVNFPDEALGMIREMLAANLDGTFDFGLAQGSMSRSPALEVGVMLTYAAEEFSDADSDSELSD